MENVGADTVMAAANAKHFSFIIITQFVIFVLANTSDQWSIWQTPTECIKIQQGRSDR
ncbi:hypothetical protein TOL_3356 [Thalassolituus oleivorans MIL-1]|uniref:Uncharacterized protein n=1 Tax=Thalassolituus oleivorans MIL-1 TaxID=1298593 RepID=M5E8N7_9GAMM|nr:hypothetical protein TOL_3356 [Thalassolituus oleivorans MIL-1]